MSRSANTMDRVCTKLAIEGEALEEGASLTFHLHLALPLSETAKTYRLMSSDGVSRLGWKIRSLNAAHEIRLKKKTDKQLAQRLKLGIDDGADKEAWREAEAAQLQIVWDESDAVINVAAPALGSLRQIPSLTSSSTKLDKRRAETRGFLVTLDVGVAYRFRPPRDPHMVR